MRACLETQAQQEGILLGKLAGALLIVVVIAGAVGLVYGLGYLGYRLSGEGGALWGGILGCVALYHGGKFAWRYILKPTMDQSLRISAELMKEMERSGQIIVAKRHKGKPVHSLKFTCGRCGRSNSIIAGMDERHYLPCLHCGFPHRLCFRGWL